MLNLTSKGNHKKEVLKRFLTFTILKWLIVGSKGCFYSSSATPSIVTNHLYSLLDYLRESVAALENSQSLGKGGTLDPGER